MTETRRAPRRSIAATSAALITMLAAVVPTVAQAPVASAARLRGADVAPRAPSAPAAVRGTVKTADGFALTLNTDGTVATIKDGTRTLPRAKTSGGATVAGGFSLRLVGGQSNLLTNPGFESGTAGWSFPGSGSYRPAVATDQHHAGTHAAKIAIAGTTLHDSQEATQTVTVVPGTAYLIGGYSRTDNLKPNSTETTAPLVYKELQAPAKIHVTMLDSGNHIMRQFWVFSYTGTSGWSRQSMGLKANPGETNLRVGIHVKQGRGTVWWDDLSVAPTFAQFGSPMTTTTAFVAGGAGTDDDKITQTSNVTGQPLQLTATYQTFDDAGGDANGLKILGKVRHTDTAGSPADRAFQVTYNLPIGALGWKYGDTPRSARVIANGVNYTFDTGTVVPTARYPWATVFDHTSDISIGSPLDKPRAFAFRYNSLIGLTITFDLGVSRSAVALQKSATFEIELFRAAPKWGFRAAIAKYYSLHESVFARRPEITPGREGIPFYSPPRDELDDPLTTPDDSLPLHLGLNVLGLGYNSSFGKPYTSWDEQHGRNIVSAAYTHHWGYFVVDNACAGSTCTYEEVRAKINAAAALDCGPVGTDPACERARDEAKAAKKATAQDINGRFRYDLLAGDYRLREIPDPALPPDPPGLNWQDTVEKYQLDEAVTETNDAGATLDAIYIDSTSGMRPVWGSVDDYDRAHYADTTMPLTFSYDTGAVSLRSFFANYLDLKRTADWAHPQGIVLVLDTNGKEQTPGGILATDMADWLLMENSIRDLEFPAATAGITADSYAMLKRVLAYQRPISSVDPKLADGSLGSSPSPANLIADSVVSRVNQSLFYGIWPGPEKFDSGNSTSWWNNPHYLAIYGAYGALLRDLARSGWEPVPNAKTSNANLWLERYGKASDDDLIIALRNETDSALTNVTVTVRLDKDGIPSVPAGTTALQKVVRPGLTFSAFALSADRTKATFKVTVPARTTALVEFDQP